MSALQPHRNILRAVIFTTLLAVGQADYAAITNSVTNAVAPTGDSARTNKFPYAALLIADCFNGRASIITADNQVVWQYGLGGMCQDAWLLPNGNILLCGIRRVQEVTPAKTVVWEYASPKETPPVEIHTCQPLPDGKALTSEGGPCRILELDAKGHIASEIKLKLEGDAHGQMRQVRKNPDGTYLVCGERSGTLYLVDAEGKVLRSISPKQVGEPLHYNWRAPHSAMFLENGNLLVSGGYPPFVAEFNHADKIIWKLTKENLPGFKFTYAAGCIRLPNGNTIITALSSEASIFEVTPEKKFVWKYTHPTLKGPTHVKIL